jgi:uncharacterized phage protein (TIGR01671 family)
METIKFRGLRTDGKGWVFGYYRKITFHDRLSPNKEVLYTKHFIGTFDNLKLFDGIFEQVEVIPETVGQYVGLTDKNGKEIYSGDYDKDYNLVHWCEKRMGWAMAVCDIPTKEIIMCHCYSCEGNFEISEIIDEKIEIIGNIFENKDLINQ